MTECDNCDFWVPEGMGYLLEGHECKTVSESIEDGIDDVLNGRIATKEEMKEAFNNDP